MNPIVCAFIAFVTTCSARACPCRSRSSHCDISWRFMRDRPGGHASTQATVFLWSRIARYWSRWRDALMFVRPATLEFFGHGWSAGLPALTAFALIRKLSCANPRWGSPRILGELRKLGIEVAKSTVEKYRLRHRKPPSPTWRSFLKDHVTELVSIDFFTVPHGRFQGALRHARAGT